MSLNKFSPRVASKYAHFVMALALIAATGVTLPLPASAESSLGSGFVFTADEAGGSLSRIDLKSGKAQSIGLPVMPHNVDVSAKAGLVFVVGVGAMENKGSGQGSGSMPAMKMGEEGGGKLAVLNIAALNRGPVAVIPAGHHPAHVVPDLAGKRVFVTDSESNSVSVIDLKTAKLVKSIATGAFPHGLRLSPDGRELYVADVKEGAVSVIDTATLAETARIPVGKAPVQVGFTPDGSRVYVSLRDENAVAAIDRTTRKVIAKIPVGRNPIQVYATPDARSVYVADQGNDSDPDNRVSVIDVASNTVVKTLTVGMGAHGVTVAPDGRYAFVTNIKDNCVSVIDVASQTVVRTIPVGKGPNGIAILGAKS